jgi:hypothetical protein
MIDKEQKAQDLVKIQELETKVITETKQLNERIAQQEAELNKVQNIQELKREADQKKQVIVIMYFLVHFLYRYCSNRAKLLSHRQKSWPRVLKR